MKILKGKESIQKGGLLNLMESYTPAEMLLLAQKFQELSEDIQDLARIEQQKGKKKSYVNADILDTL